jgi:hypothetical protein
MPMYSLCSISLPLSCCFKLDALVTGLPFPLATATGGAVPGPRHRPHIHDTSRTVCLTQADEFLERADGVTNRHYQR